MEKLTLKLIAGKNFYWVEEHSDLKLVHLGHWLIDDVGCDGIMAWKEWMNDSSKLGTAGNYGYIEKNAESVMLWFVYDYFENVLQAPVFETSVRELNYVLDRWQEACEKKPKKIIITCDDGVIAIDFGE